MSYVEVEITTNQQQLTDLAIEKLKEELEGRGIVGWEANDADREVIELGVSGLLASNVALVASVVPPAVFRKYGTELLGVAYREGANATVKTKWTLLEEGGKYPPHTIEAGTQLALGEQAFYVENDVSVSEGESSVTVQLVASERGTEFNGLTGTLNPVDQVNWLSEVTIIGESSGGANQETDEEYLDRLAALLALQAPRPITAADFAAFALQAPSTILPTGVVVGRAAAIEEYNPVTATYGNLRTVTVFVTDVEGNALTSEAMTALATWLEGYREANFNVFVRGPEYTDIFVTTIIHVESGYVAASVVASAKAALAAFLSKATWGNPRATTTGTNQWLAEEYRVVRYNACIGVIEATPGVAYVFPGSSGLAIGTTASPSGTSDITMAGPAPLPKAEELLVTAS